MKNTMAIARKPQQLFKHKSFFKDLLHVALPISMQSLLQSSLNMIDQIMVGQLGEQTIAAVGLGLRPIFIYTFVLMAMAGGGSVYVAQFWGKKDYSKIAQVVGSMLLLGGGITLLAGVVCVFFPSQLMHLFTVDQDVIEQGVLYQVINAIGFLPLMLSVIYGAVLRSTGFAKLIMKIGIAKVILNTILNYILIFGVAGYPYWQENTITFMGSVPSAIEGLKGAAIATVISQFFEAIVLLAIVYRRKLTGSFSFKQLTSVPWSILKPILLVSLPLMLGDFSWAVGESAYMFIYGRMGTSEVAAITMTFPLQALTIGFFTGLSAAAAILIGQQLGAGKLRYGMASAKKIVSTGLIITIPLAFVIAITSWKYIDAYNVPPEAASYARTICIIFSVLFPIKVSNMIIGGGVLRSGGDTKFTTRLGLFSTWVFSIPIGLLAAFVFNLPVYLVYIAVSIEEILRIIVVSWRMQSGKWVRNLVDHL
ncbi:MATE family efflux transporter [Limibacter armeniacum]|uniref:MATE family efflux transporter n=1 Tax=Limibacter armeniacum TaxID=466084 RepID=UPI002FE5A979